MINVTIENFDDEVVAASMQTPVLVDFWAPWCGPCKVIGPLLEKIETDYAGRFKLAKIDSDAQQELSQAFGIRSIPTCVLMFQGKPVDGFTGALPEGKIKEFLDKHLPEGDVLEAMLHMDYMKVRQSFGTRNHNRPPHEIRMDLLNGPFKSLSGTWRFTPLGDLGCKIEFRLDYEFASSMLSTLIGPVFNRIATTLVDAFIQEADRRYDN